MRKISLNGKWDLRGEGVSCAGEVPGSVYSFLLACGGMPDPYYRDNELGALKLMDKDYTFSRTFAVSPEFAAGPALLRCEGLDTVCSLRINGKTAGEADNMHRIWEFDVTGLLQSGENTIEIFFPSVTKFIKQRQKEDYVGGTYHAMDGFPHVRKAHCMFGWDWGPRLPDAGIWRGIYLIDGGARITDLHIRQRHESGKVFVRPALQYTGEAEVQITMTAPSGEKTGLPRDEWTEVVNPELWWPRGYGGQPLYTLEAALAENGGTADRAVRRIGLRTMTVTREKDQWGECFDQTVNGVRFFAMGADYIPEDNILSRVTPERTRRLLEQCAAANFNSIRVWGGGYYPEDFFFDVCDELGLVVWQDFMFSCANYRLTLEFERSIRAEFADNIRRMRHHASLGLWCGNNEMEMFQSYYAYNGTDKTRSDYIRMFEHIIPEVLREYDPDTFYWPASPSSGGGFYKPNDPDMGDVHYWDVWHGGKPFADYRNHYFRYVSEFGFQSFPDIKTVQSYTLPSDRNIFSRVMEMHQRNEGANGKILQYLSQTFLYPADLETLLYASQLLQAEAIRCGVEHWRRNRGRCMGAIYWQLNDIWPVASWASIDYFGRWKALHYYARRFFAPIMISCLEAGETTDRVSVVTEPSPIETSSVLCVANETPREVKGEARWTLRDSYGKPLDSGVFPFVVPRLSSYWCGKLDFGCTDFLENYLSYEFVTDGAAVSRGTVIFTAPKHFHFRDPGLTARISGRKITVTARAYAKGVEIYSPDCDLVLSDNYFDMDPGEVTVEILEGQPEGLALRSVFDIR
ncbi:MAG: glycoside hydrolase family 2 protein [Clostridiales bacterium]|jgi:beta-mannosidase|nr:glycoside hydrolase family 2 protein [Clostridiales bacterium]